ncbi:basic amino acid ABC transporter substrate-binding protein [Lysinibacillus sp. PLM2]|nr:basic amino acid ABC transporter substrate-binding protein [Lysinibacillus sp. PLM2]
MLKKNSLLMLLVLAALTFVLAACGTSSDNSNSSEGTNGSETATETEGTSSEAEEPAETKELLVGTDAAYAPFESMDDNGNIVGIDVDIVNALAEELGVKAEIQHVGWEPLFTQVTNGQVDFGISAITITEERQETFDFTEPYYEATQLIITKEDSGITSLQDLKDKKIGVQINTTGHYAAQDLQGQASTNILTYETTPIAIQQMINGTVDAVIGDNAVLIEFIKTNPDSNLITIEDDSFESEYYGLMVKKGNTELLDLLNEGIQKLKESGKLAEITGQELE